MALDPPYRFDPEAGLKGLPFVRQISEKLGSPACFWCAPSIGDGKLDFELGSLLGLALLKYFRQERQDDRAADHHPDDDLDGEFTDLFLVVGSMINRRRCGDVESGFLSVLERYLVGAVHPNPESGWVDPATELDRPWVWFEQEVQRVWSAAPLRWQLPDDCCAK